MAIETNELIDVKALPPFKKFIMTIGNIPTSYLESMTYAELLMWFCNYLQNTVIPTVNNNAEAIEELQELIEQINIQEEVNNKLDEMAEDGTLESIVADYITNDFIAKVDNYINPINLGGYVTLLNSSSTGATKTDEQIKQNISDLVDAKVENYNLIVEIMPSSEQKTAYEGSTITVNDLVLNCYPDLTTLNTYIDYAKDEGLNLYSLNFHSLWAKEHLASADYLTFITKYKNAVISIINGLNNKPVFSALFNEYYNIFTGSTISSIIDCLTSVKNTNVNVGLDGITEQIIEYNLDDYVDAFLPHFYPYATMKGNDATIQDVYEGIERSRTGEKIILRLQKLNPNIPVIINECGASGYWEALAQPEKYWGNVAGATADSTGMAMGLYAKGALRYYSQFNINGMFIFWTDTVPTYLKKFFLDYYERGEI